MSANSDSKSHITLQDLEFPVDDVRELTTPLYVGCHARRRVFHEVKVYLARDKTLRKYTSSLGPLDHSWRPLEPTEDESNENPDNWDTATYVSAQSAITSTTFYTAVSAHGDRTTVKPVGLKATDEYARLLESKNLWPVDASIEQNWSGIGQHVEFRKGERKLINDLLEVHETLGSTTSTIVQSVKCLRILLARKTISTSKHFTKAQAVEEVAHLTRLKHAHILQVIGTYVVGKELSILLYPVAKCNLQVFLKRARTSSLEKTMPLDVLDFCEQCFSCLSAAVQFIHKRMTKHMDIKPQNILVYDRQRQSTTEEYLSRNQRYQSRYTVLIADFGIARSYQSLDAIETDGRTAFSPKYAAPEVAEQEMRGLPADIFSLGCVFLELLVFIDDASNVFGTTYRQDGLASTLYSNADGDFSYQANIKALVEYIQSMPDAWVIAPFPSVSRLREPRDDRQMIIQMLREDPHNRPSAGEIAIFFGKQDCCEGPPCPLEAFEEGAGSDNEDELENNVDAEVLSTEVEYLSDC